ncbi:Gfo/Idh/MocA family protein [Haloarchaeobius sp. HRN-SO-5]|uniref:Gfo/Idh/MocA family protein n=1 Tax=Haloarchaeobius sp. HRN-SO-5 TaxID=3446118 RepID=UPI003EBF7449
MVMQIGFIGVGGLGFLQCRTFAEMDDVHIVAAADVTQGARDLFEEEFGAPAYEHYRTLLGEHGDELDAVAIVTPHTLHYEQASAALRQGVNVLVEKPMVTDVAHAVDLVETAAERELVLQVGYQRHFHPAFREIRRIIQSGRIGDVHTVNCYLGQDWIEPHRETWRGDTALSGGGQLYDSGSHLLDALLWTTESRPATVMAEMEFDSPGLDVNSSLSIRLESDGDPILASVAISGDGVEMDIAEGYFYWGTGGRLSYVDGVIEVTETNAVTYTTELTQGTDFETLDRAKLENFVESVRGDVEPAVPGEVGLQVTGVTEAAYTSAEEGRRVDVQALIDDARAERD